MSSFSDVGRQMPVRLAEKEHPTLESAISAYAKLFSLAAVILLTGCGYWLNPMFMSPGRLARISICATI